MSHLVKLQVFLVGDPALGGRMDNEGFSRAYAEFFGTPEQPHLVTRTRVQVVGLVNPGWLVEIDAIAVR
jgi:enamine deaminase RidA (YjgF/YER057c/UK114 family)